MNPPAEESLAKALELTPSEFVELSDRLIETLSPPESDMTPEEWSAYWSKELARRVDAFERGETEASDYRESVERIRQSLQQST